MKKVIFIFSAVLALTLIGCEADFSKGINKDYKTGISVTNDGLSFDEYYLSVNGERLENNEVKLGEKVYLNFTGVDGFEEVNGAVFPGAAMQVTDRDGNQVLQEVDLFADYNTKGVDVADAENLSVSLIVGDPMVAGETYNWKVKFWDKKEAGEIRADLDIEVK